MASRQQLFVEESDDDSINTNTTAGSEQDDEKDYPVERILAEEKNDEGRQFYLVKWEGYPLHRASWEPRENFTDPGTLNEWTKTKQEAANGGEPLFDVDDWYEAVENAEDAKERKKKLRNAKRRRRGETIPTAILPPETNSDSDEPLPTTEAPKRTIVNDTSLKRKGVTTIVTSPKKKPTTEVNDADERPSRSSSFNSLFHDPNEWSTRSGQTPTSHATIPSVDLGKAKSQSSVVRPKNAGPVTTAAFTNSTAAPKTTATVPQKVVRKAAPSGVGTAKRSKNVFGANWQAPKKRKERQRVSGQTPKDSTDPKFRNLSTQNRYQNYSKNEPAPDINALTMIDPKTGRAQPPKAAPTPMTAPLRPPPAAVMPDAPARGPTNIHSAYGRRTPPRQVLVRSRSRSPPEPEPKPAVPEAPAAASKPQQDGFGKTSTSTRGPPAKQIVCRYWRMGTCQRTAATCKYAHESLTKKVTCNYWLRGCCKFTAEQCSFAHYDTGVHAGEPGTFLQSGHQSSDSRMSHVDQTLPTPSRPVPPSESGPQASEPSLAHQPLAESAPNRTIHPPADQPPNPPRSPPRDPRLRSRLSVVTDDTGQPLTQHQLQSATEKPASAEEAVLTKPSAQDSAIFQSPSELDHAFNVVDSTSDAMVLDTMSDAVVDDFQPSNPDRELHMANAAIQNLNLLPLISLPKDRMIENVFVQVPSGREVEMRVLTRKLKEFHRKVYTSHTPGHWDVFCRMKGDRLIVVHPHELFLSSLPGLSKLLQKGDEVTVFSVGVQRKHCWREDREDSYEALRLFPHGRMIFITDDVFVYYPEKATQIILNFNKVARSKPEGTESSKIGARPGIKQWLRTLIEKKYQEEGPDCAADARDYRYLQCWDALCQLCPIEEEDILNYPDHEVPKEDSFLWSICEEELPSIKGKWESGDEEGTTDYLINLFAGEAVDAAWVYRRFLVIYQRPEFEEVKEPPKAQQWMQQYSQIFVQTPDQMLQK
jgi:hypothetical protein